MMERKKGQRVFVKLENYQTGETKQRWGTVERDEIPLWDYTYVVFDDFPNYTTPILSYYLFDENQSDGEQ